MSTHREGPFPSAVSLLDCLINCVPAPNSAASLTTGAKFSSTATRFPTSETPGLSRGGALVRASLRHRDRPPKSRRSHDIAFAQDGRPSVARFLDSAKSRRSVGATDFSDTQAEASFGLIERSPDHLASFFMGHAALPSVFAVGEPNFADNKFRR